MGTEASRERKINYLLSYIHNNQSVLIDKEKMIAVASIDMLTSERVIREILNTLEKAGRIDKRVWK